MKMVKIMNNVKINSLALFSAKRGQRGCRTAADVLWTLMLRREVKHPSSGFFVVLCHFTMFSPPSLRTCSECEPQFICSTRQSVKRAK